MFVQDHHDRMPVLRRPGQLDRWLSGESGKKSGIGAEGDASDIPGVAAGQQLKSRRG
jgi:hypothetical protein